MRSDFNLSRNKSLRALETTAASITAAGDTASGFLETVLSTITSPPPLDVVITYQDTEFDFRTFTRKKPVRVDCAHLARFKVFGEMHRVRGFRLVLCADVLDCMAEDAIRALEHIVEVERADGGLDYLLCEPLIISERRSPRTRPEDIPTGYVGGWPISASAL